MKFLGYKRKKGSSIYYTDNLLNPTFFRPSPNQIGFIGRQPVFKLNFEITNIYSIASGSALHLKDIDTGIIYIVVNNEIFNFFQYIREGQITVEGDIYEGTFIYQKVGKSFVLKLATQEDIELIDDEIPEIE
jgi:hypothetical protein